MPSASVAEILLQLMPPADGVVIESHGLIIDEASLTGEADPIKKTLEDPWVRSGTQVCTHCSSMRPEVYCFTYTP